MATNTWVNDDGLLVRFYGGQGLRDVNGVTRGSVTNSTSKEQEFVIEFDLEGAARTMYTTDLNNDGTYDGFTELDSSIPAGVIITAVEWMILETPAGGTAYEVGTYQKDGTAIDIDGIINDNTGPEVGDDVGSGAVTTQRQWVTAVTTGTYTAGKIRVIIRYVIV